MIFKGPPSQCPPLEKSLGDFILTTLKENGDQLYQIDPYTDSRLTQCQIRSLSIRVALQFQKLGLKKGDVITICTTNHKYTVLPFLAAIYLGVTINPLEKIFNDNEISRIVNIVQPQMVLCDEVSVERFKKITGDLKLKIPVLVADTNFEENFLHKPEAGVEDQFEAVDVDVFKTNVMIICSSGTTGMMKGVQHTHNTFYHAVYDTGYVAKPTDLMYTNTTMAWNAAPWLMLYSIIFATPRITAALDCPILDIMKLIKKYKVTHMNATPTELVRMFRHPDYAEYKDALQSLRVLWSRGAANTEKQMKLYRTELPNTHVMNGIGCTEMGMLMAYFDSDKEYDLNIQKVTSNGKLCPGVIGKVMDREGEKEVGVKEQGELWLKAESMTPGYYANPEANSSTFTSDGWYRTGDMAYFDEDECLFVIGRYKEIFKYETSWVIPSEVEYIINQHPKVHQSCVMGIPDDEFGDLPMAFIIKKPGMEVTEDEIIKYVEERASDHQFLRGGVQFVNDFPRTASGKIRRFELQKILNKKD